MEATRIVPIDKVEGLAIGSMLLDSDLEYPDGHVLPTRELRIKLLAWDSEAWSR